MKEAPFWSPQPRGRAAGEQGTDAFGAPLVAGRGQWEPAPPEQPPQQAGGARGRIAGTLAGTLALVAKFGGVLKGLLFALPNLKLLTSAGTALISIAAYTLFFPWSFAVGFVALLFIHELGHVIQLRREGLPASAPMFVPFLGALIAAKSLGDNALAEARVGLAGPVLGTAGAGVVAIAGALLQPSYAGQLLLALAYVGFFINLFNLIPVVPFDGGRAMAAVAPGMWFLGIAGLALMAVLYQSLFMLAFIFLALHEMPARWRQLRARTLLSAAYYRVPKASRIRIGLVYLTLIVVLAVGMGATHILTAEGHSFSSL